MPMIHDIRIIILFMHNHAGILVRARDGKPEPIINLMMKNTK